MKLAEMQLLFAAVQGASDKTQLAVASAMYAIERARREDAQIQEDLDVINRLVNEAIPKFNWGASCLDADAISLLNRAPAAMARILEHYKVLE